MQWWLNRTKVVLGVCVLLGSAVRASGDTVSSIRMLGHERFVKLCINFVAPGVELGMLRKDIIESDISPTSGQRIVAKTKNRILFVRDLRDLRGFVRIGSGVQALNFVRLATSWNTYNAMMGSSQVEIISYSQEANMPNYGLDSYDTVESEAWFIGPGCRERVELTNNVFRRDGLSQPVVKKTSDGYRILRWIYEFGPGEKEKIVRIEETVGKDGDYSQKIVQTMPERIFKSLPQYRI